MTDPLAAAVAANDAVSIARESLREAVVARSAAIQAAFAAGYTAPQLAEALGVKHAQRIYAMSKQ